MSIRRNSGADQSADAGADESADAGAGEPADIVPADSLELSALAALFRKGYSDYALPLQLDDGAFRDHAVANDIDLSCSRVAVVGGEPAAMALIARRGPESWVGGMATVPAYRRRGFGERVLLAGLEAAFSRGSQTVWLEVLTENRAAIALYDKLGFKVTRDLIVWSLATSDRDPATSRSVDPRAAHRWITAQRESREPWQRADASLTRMLEHGGGLRGLMIERAGSPVGAVLYRERDETVIVLQAAALDDAAAEAVLLAAAGGEGSLRLANVPGDDRFSRVFERLGARAVARQHEMCLRPNAHDSA
jgi:GNAT superfamily N-acetyltransferase